MARFGRDHDAQTLVVAGVRFMGETAKILSPDKRILMPDLDATCSLDLGCPGRRIFRVLRRASRSHGGRLRQHQRGREGARGLDGDVVDRARDRRRSACARRKDPLGARSASGRLHPEEDRRRHAAVAGLVSRPRRVQGHRTRSAARRISATRRCSCIRNRRQRWWRKPMWSVRPRSSSMPPCASTRTHFIVATDLGILHKMRLAAPGKTFIDAPTAGNSATCKSCAHCPWMAMNGLREPGRRARARPQRDLRRSGDRRAGASADRPDARLRRASQEARAGERRSRAKTARCFRTWGGLMGAGLSERLRIAALRGNPRAIRRGFRCGARAQRRGCAGRGHRRRRPDRPARSRRRRAHARIIVREEAVLCGVPWFNEVMRRVDPSIDVRVAYREGDRMAANSPVVLLRGPARALLTAERNGLNFLQLLSGVATRDAPLSSMRSKARARASSIRARRCRDCGSRRSTRCVWAAARTSGSRSTTAS